MELNGTINYFFFLSKFKNLIDFKGSFGPFSLSLPLFNLAVVCKDHSVIQVMVMNRKFSKLPGSQEEITKSFKLDSESVIFQRVQLYFQCTKFLV